MNNDIKIENNNIIFNYNVAIVIRNNNKILIQKDTRAKHITLPGGRCVLGESSQDPAIREFLEETGIKTKYIKSLGMIENFFISSFNNKKYHEILIIQELEFINNEDYKKELIKNIEKSKKDFLTYEWIDIEKLKDNNFKPDIAVDIINKEAFIHYINKEY